MGILSWLQCKFTAKHEKRVNGGSSSIRRTSLSELLNKEVIDSLHPLLAIGTFGADDLNEDAWRSDASKRICSADTAEELMKLRSDLSKLGDGSAEQNDEEDAADLSPDNKIILDRSDNCSVIKKVSTSFLLEKMLICRGGFGLTSEFKDPVAESRVLEKLPKALLHKKVYPQQPARTQRRKYLEKSSKEKECFEHEMNRERASGGRWVRTDSEYIVLEMKAADEV